MRLVLLLIALSLSGCALHYRDTIRCDHLEADHVSVIADGYGGLLIYHPDGTLERAVGQACNVRYGH